MRIIRQSSLIFIIFVSLTAARPTLAHMADAKIDRTTESPSVRFERALSLSQNGEKHAAIQELSSLRSDYPQDVDYVLARAQILAELHKDELALNDLSIGLELAPDYVDLWILHHRILARRTGAMAAAELEAFRLDAAARFPDATWWQEPLESKYRWTLIAGGGYERLSENLPNWNSQFVELQFEQDATFRYLFQISRDERFAGADLGVRLGAEHARDSGWTAGLELTAARSPSFMPKVGFSGHLSKALPDGWLIDLQYRRRQFSTTVVSSVHTTAEKYIANFRIAYSLGLSQLSGSSTLANHTLTGAWYYDEGSSIAVSVSTGREAESIGLGQVLETDVHGVALAGRQALSDRLGLHWWIGSHEQGDFYRRRFIGMALSIRI